MIFFRRKNKKRRNSEKPKTFRRSAFHIGVNIFVGFFEILILLLLLAIGFMQTSTFRNLLKDELTEAVNNEINGEFFLENLKGTILTTIELDNFGLKINDDTLFFARKFKSELSVLALINKKILFKKISVAEPKIKILETEKGKWNYSLLLPQSEKTETAKEEKTKSGKSNFPFILEIGEFKIENAEFVYKNFEHLYSDSVYRFVNYDDIKIEKLNLSLNAVGDFSKNDYYFSINDFSFNDNLSVFRLKNFSATAHVTEKFTELKKLSVETDSTKLSLAAKLVGFSPFGNLSLTKKLPVKAQLTAEKFYFGDLSTFLPSLSFLNGNIGIDFSATGIWGDLSVDKLNVELNETKLALVGKLQNLHKAEDLFIEAKIKGNLNYDEVETLLAGLELPDFNNLKFNDISLNYKGEPLKFNTDISAKLDTAEIYAKAFMDITGEPIVYDYEIAGKNVDLFPVLGEKTNLTLEAQVKGSGFDLPTSKNKIHLFVNNSSFGKIKISKLNFNSVSDSGAIKLGVSGIVNNAKFKNSGNLTLGKNNNALSARGNFSNLNFASFLHDTTYSSDVNFSFSVAAENFLSPNLSGEVSLSFDSTIFRGNSELSGKNFVFSLWGDSLARHLDLKSSLIDAEISGKFDYEILPEIISGQTERIAATINKSIISKISHEPVAIDSEPQSFGDADFSYNIIFNSTDFWAKILNVDALTVAGYSFGTFKNSAAGFRLKSSSFFSNFVYIDGEEVYYFDNVNLKTDIKNSNLVNSIDSLRVSLSLKGDKIIAGSQFTETNSALSLDGKNLYLNLNTIIDSSFAIRSSANLSAEEKLDKIVFEQLDIASKGVVWKNELPIELSVSDGKLFFKKFELKSDSAIIKLDGNLALDETSKSKLNFKLGKSPIQKLGKMFLGDALGFEGTVNFEAQLTGKLASPEINSKLVCMGLSYNKIAFGNIFFAGKYNNSVSEIDLKLINNRFIRNSTVLSLIGSVDKSLFGEEATPGKLNLRFKTNDFNLSALSALSNDIKNIHGKLNADIEITGDVENPVYNGYARLENGKFYVTANGLDYYTGAEFTFKDRILSIDKFYLKNDPATGFDGKIDVHGQISLNKQKLGVLNLELNGGLGLLSEKTKFVNPYFYGNLYVETGNRWKFSYVNDKAFLEGKLKIVDADITISSTSGGETVDISDIDYIYAVDSTNISENEAQKLLEKYFKAQLAAAESKNDAENESFFDYNLTFDIVNRATLNFVFSKVANQKLKAIIDGSMKISSIDNENVVQGEFRLLPGSRLDFFRSFDASGTIRFERDLLNPYLDITALYKGVHYKNMQAGVAEEDVAVKIKLQGLLKDLGENFTAKKSNIAVYVGKKNIDNNIPDPKLNASDAMTFILFGKFNDDLTSSEQYKFSNELTSTTTALLGTMMGVFLNSAMGDLINDVDISQTQTRTKVMLKGRLGRFYYSIGGSQEVFQDIAQANWKVEYFFNKNLSFRIERREPLTGYLSNTQMTDEVGIKYKVSF